MPAFENLPMIEALCLVALEELEQPPSAHQSHRYATKCHGVCQEEAQHVGGVVALLGCDIYGVAPVRLLVADGRLLLDTIWHSRSRLRWWRAAERASHSECARNRRPVVHLRKRAVPGGVQAGCSSGGS